MKLSTNRVVGIIAVVLAIVAAVVLGRIQKERFLSKEPTELLEVEYRQWICDEAKLLDGATVKTVEQYNEAWDEKYYAVVAVATLERLNGWDSEKYAAALGKKWGLGENDMILVLLVVLHHGAHIVAHVDLPIATLHQHKDHVVFAEAPLLTQGRSIVLAVPAIETLQGGHGHHGVMLFIPRGIVLLHRLLRGLIQQIRLVADPLAVFHIQQVGGFFAEKMLLAHLSQRHGGHNGQYHGDDTHHAVR